MTTRGVQIRLFLTCWIIYAAHFATDFVREHYLVASIVEDHTFDLTKYNGLHVDIFENPEWASHGGVHHGANPGISFLGAIPYFVLRPGVDRVVAWEQRNRGDRDTLAVYRDETRPRRLAFYATTRRMGLDVRFGLIGIITAALCMAPLTAASVVVVFRLLAAAGLTLGLSLALSLVYAFATPTFFRASYLNQNLGVAIFSILAFLLLWNPAGTIRWRASVRQIVAGFLGGFCLLMDYSGGLSLAVLGAYLALTEWRDGTLRNAIQASLRYTLGALPPILMLFFYQWASFGHPFYPPQHYMPPVDWIEVGYQGVGGPQWELFVGLLFDGRYGLIWSAPVLALAAVTPFLLRRQRPSPIPRRELLLCYAITVAYVVFFSAVQYTRLQWVTGVRYLLPVVPFLFIAAVPALLRLPRVVTYTMIGASFITTWAMTLVRSQTGIVDAIVRVALEGVQLPALRTLSRMSTQYVPWLEGYATSWPTMLVMAAVIVAIWLPRPLKPLSAPPPSELHAAS